MSITYQDLASGKVKPEFGNLDHIHVVRAYEAHAARHDPDTPKKPFKVTLHVTGSYETVVQAVDAEHAKELGEEEGINVGDLESVDVEVEEVEEVKE